MPTTKQDVYALIEKKADTLRERSGYALSKAEAIDRVVRNEPELYTAYVNAPDAPVVEKHEPTPVKTVKQVAEEGILRIADEIERREQCDRLDAISKAAATTEGRVLYDMIRNPAYATMPAEELTARVDQRTQKAAAAKEAQAVAKADLVLKVTEAIMEELGAACDAAGISRPVRKVVPFTKLQPGKAYTFNEIRALKAS